jgi:hypothetical protein
MKFQVLMVARMMTAFWAVVAYSLLEVDQRFTGASSGILSMMEAVRISEMSICFHETTQPTSQEAVIIYSELQHVNTNFTDVPGMHAE